MLDRAKISINDEEELGQNVRCVLNAYSTLNRSLEAEEVELYKEAIKTMKL